jgi:hypothetical protein
MDFPNHHFNFPLTSQSKSQKKEGKLLVSCSPCHPHNHVIPGADYERENFQRTLPEKKSLNPAMLSK